MFPTFTVFNLQIPMFGVMMMCGMLAAFLLLFFTRRIIRFTEDQLFSVAIWAILLGFLGSKILYWIVEWKHVVADPKYLLQTLRSGFVFYGGLIGGVLGILIYACRQKLPFLALVDLLIPSLVIGQAFGRIGCFLAGCCYGAPSECALAVTFPAGSSAPAGVPLLPTQLFESAFLFVLTFVLVRIMKLRKPFGTVFGWYGILYGVWRFIIEFFRSDDRGAVGALSTSQFIGIFIVLAGIVILLLIKRGVLRTAELPDETVKASIEEEDALYEEGELKAELDAAKEQSESASAEETAADEIADEQTESATEEAEKQEKE